jgi:AmiR/NasT family two-component response regulator
MGNGSPLEHIARVAQAQGVVSVQAACSTAEALDLMKDRAIVQGQTLDEVVEALLDRSIRFGE